MAKKIRIDRKCRELATRLALLVGVLVSQSADAGVTLKNGNFFMGYVDLVYSGGLEAKIERVYNSKSADLRNKEKPGFNGWFGVGWGSLYESYLSLEPNGDLVVHEYGAGAEVAFGRVKNENGAPLSQFKKLEDAPVGTQWIAKEYGYQYITKMKDGFLRSYDSGREDRFSDSGRLNKLSDKNGNFIEITLGTDGKFPLKIVDQQNRKLVFKYNGRNKVKSVEGENGQVALYRYNARDELEWSKDVDGHVFDYSYDQDGLNLLVKIKYEDKTEMAMTYYGEDRLYSIKSVKDRDGSRTEYDFDFDAQKDGKTSAKVKKMDKEGEVISVASYDYFVKKGASGQDWNYKMVSIIDGEQTETTYNECCGLPLTIKRDGKLAEFKYDQKARLIYKKTPTELTQLVFDPKAGKVSKVEVFTVANGKPSSRPKSWSRYGYDDRTNLVLVEDSQGRKLRLAYHPSGQIAGIRDVNDKKGRRFEFVYPAGGGALTEIVMTDAAKQVQRYKVKHTPSGEIETPSNLGPKERGLATVVAGVFKMLTDSIKPAGVSLSF